MTRLEPPDFDRARRRLETHVARRLPRFLARRRAAVALVLRPSADGQRIELLFVKRATRRGDPWSGDMAFPGGLTSPSDPDPTGTAVRETREEVGLDLERYAERVTTLSEQLTLSPDRRPLTIRPIVFCLGVEPPELSLHPGEVDSAHWIDLAFFYRQTHHTTLARRYLGIPMTFTCYRFEGLAIWGLTLRMVRDLLRALDAPDAPRAGPDVR